MFVEIKNARKKYGEGASAVNALDGVDLTLDKGEMCVILGPSGSGKSTLLNMMGGLDSLDEGEFSVNGINVSSLKKKELTEFRRREIGFVFQFYNLVPDLTAKENIEVVCDIAKQPLDLDEIMEALDIKQLSNRFPRELSGGQQQRVAIARALIKNPSLLLCDELTGALDSKSSRSVLEIVEKVNKGYHTTIVIITHNEQIAQMADRIIRIKDGKIISNEKNKQKLEVSAMEF